MKAVAKHAARTLDILTKGLDVGEGRKIANSSTFMPVSVNRLAESHFSVTHYYEQNGDLVPDPDMVFYRHPGIDGENVWLPVSFQNSLVYNECMTFKDGKPTHVFNPRMQADLASFAGVWMRNIRAQQDIKLPRVPRRKAA